MPLKSEILFENASKKFADHGAEVVKKVQAIFHFELKETKDSKPEFFTLDFKNGNGSFAKGKIGKADATFSMLDDTLIKLTEGKLNPQNAFMQGQMKIKGNMAKAMKFTPDLLPKDAKL